MTLHPSDFPPTAVAVHSSSLLFMYDFTYFTYLLILGCVGFSLLQGHFSSYSGWGSAPASYHGGFSCCRVWALGCAGFSNCGPLARQFLLRGSVAPWHDPPWPRIKPVSLELADRFFTTEPPGKPWSFSWFPSPGFGPLSLVFNSPF